MSSSKSTYRASICVVILAVLLAGCSPSQEATQPENPQVLIQTSLGAIKVEIYEKKALITAPNFLRYGVLHLHRRPTGAGLRRHA